MRLPLLQSGTAPICGPYLLWQMAGSIKMPLGVAVGLGPGDYVLDEAASLSPKTGRNPSQIFGPFLLWPNGSMHQDATWYGGRPQPRGLCVRWGPSSIPKKGAEPSSPIFGPCLLWPYGSMDQDGTWHIKVGLGPGHIVLDGDPAPLPKKGTVLLDTSRCHLVGRR